MAHRFDSRCPMPLASAVFAFGLSACGGGGSPAPSVVVPEGPRAVAASAGSDVSVGNYVDLASPLVRALLSGGGSDLLDPLAGERAAPLAHAAARPVALASGALLTVPTLTGRTVLAWWMRAVAAPQRKRIAAVQSETLPCAVAGQITVSFDDADNDNTVSAGDTIGVDALNCIDEAALPAIDGSFSMRVNGVELDGQGEPTALDVSGRFEAFTLAGYGTLDGSFRLWTRQETAASSRLRLRYEAATFTETTGNVTYDFDIDGLANSQGGSFEISGGLRLGGHTYALSTATRLQYALGQPPAIGAVDLRDAAADGLRVVARSQTLFDLEFRPVGSTVPTAVTAGLVWADFED